MSSARGVVQTKLGVSPAASTRSAPISRFLCTNSKGSRLCAFIQHAFLGWKRAADRGPAGSTLQLECLVGWRRRVHRESASVSLMPIAHVVGSQLPTFCGRTILVFRCSECKLDRTATGAVFVLLPQHEAVLGVIDRESKQPLRQTTQPKKA